LKSWKFTDNKGVLEMVMKLLLDRQDDMNLDIIKNLVHQVFGAFLGCFILDDGKKTNLKLKLGSQKKSRTTIRRDYFD